MLKDYRSAPIADKEKALFALVEKINQDSTQIEQPHIDKAKSAGWSDEALYDAIMVCSLFRLMNTWLDATGVQGMPAAAYAASGARLAAQGYVPRRRSDECDG